MRESSHSTWANLFSCLCEQSLDIPRLYYFLLFVQYYTVLLLLYFENQEIRGTDKEL